MEEPPVLPPPAILEPISRPSSASTTASQKDSLPGISAIAAAAAAAAATVTSSPQLGFRYVRTNFLSTRAGPGRQEKESMPGRGTVRWFEEGQQDHLRALATATGFDISASSYTGPVGQVVVLNLARTDFACPCTVPSY